MSLSDHCRVADMVRTVYSSRVMAVSSQASRGAAAAPVKEAVRETTPPCRPGGASSSESGASASA